MKNGAKIQRQRRIAIVGAGHVGLVSAACFAELGHIVKCLDIDEERILSLKEGKLPFYEPDLPELVQKTYAAGNLIFTTSYPEAVGDAEFVFIAVATPTSMAGYPDLHNVAAAGREIMRSIGTNRPIIVSKSTGPVGISQTLNQVNETESNGMNLPIVSNPEFLQEGTAVKDFMVPDRIVLGSDDLDARAAVGELYEPLGKPIVYTDMNSAEMIKYACNAFLATKISFINEIAQICERVGADVRDVATGMGLDHRIGPHFLNAGIGFGGSCLPKDVRALSYMGSVYGSHPQLLSAVLEINSEQRRRVIGRLRESLGGLRRAKIALFGLAFKPETDDIRDAPALDLIQLLEYEGAEVIACDPVAAENAARLFPNLSFESDPYAAAEGCDAVVIATEWKQFRELDLPRLRSVMRTPVIADGRNALNQEQARKDGFVYFGIGVPSEATVTAGRAVAV
ncbi:MAG TPA: UDP-glucose/GDP-mannose dehydrogenase family protein [Dehalococcoidia bacterium]|nr:UDP-glucose/GDP-mannose dehydrogenase family protein [Dehalococcoidia bacterium]